MKKKYIITGICIALIAVVAVSRVGHIGYPTASSVATTASPSASGRTDTVSVPVLKQEMVTDAMQAYASSSAFTYSGKEYPSLGFFVESINGKNNAGGYYWTLYIDGTLSELGASSARVAPGQSVEWRYQQGAE